MIYKSFKNKKLKVDPSKCSKYSDDCMVSKASNEIMLDRFYNGKGVEFPFT